VKRYIHANVLEYSAETASDGNKFPTWFDDAYCCDYPLKVFVAGSAGYGQNIGAFGNPMFLQYGRILPGVLEIITARQNDRKSLSQNPPGAYSLAVIIDPVLGSKCA